MSDEDLPKLVGEMELNENLSDSDGNDDDWEEMETQEEPTKCLFCEKIEKSIDDSVEHLKLMHNFDLSEVKEKFSMDQYKFIKMVNYIRFTKITKPNEILELKESVWEDDKYLQPVEYEPWLSYDIESVKTQIIKAPVEETEIQKLQRQINELKRVVQEKDNLLEEAANNIATMKQSFNNLLLKEEDKSRNVEEKRRKPGVENGVASVPLEDDEGYFSGYSHFSIHHSMLSDRVRTESYRNAILQNSNVLKEKIVMDLGSGTSILSMFASQAGAQKVYSVDQSEIIYKAMEIVNTNKFKNIEFVKGRLEDVEFPVKKVDVIISEWMGYFLLFEGMLDSVIYARNNYLKEGGYLLPNRCNISLVGYGDQTRYLEFIDFFKDVYSFDMSCMIEDILKEAHVENCSAEFVLTSPNIIADLDLMTVDMNCPNFSYNFSLEVTKPGKLTSLVGYFDTFFELPDKVEFSTSPFADPTHWKQVVFFLDKMYEVNVGDVIKGTFICQRDRKDLRSLKIAVEIFGKTFKYDLN